MDNSSVGQKRGRNMWLLLLLIPFIATLWPPFYNSLTPEWQGIPFFYWYLILWVIICAVINAIVYFITA